jgi:hypothetical protein
MKRLVIAIALVACGHPSHSGGDDGPAADATVDALIDASTDGATDGATDGPTDASTGPIPLVACGSPVELDSALPIAWSFDSFVTYQAAPWLLTGDTARVFYDSTSQVMTAAHSSATTAGWASSLAGATYVAPMRSASGAVGVAFEVGGQPMFSRVTGGAFGPAIEIPCTSAQIPNGACDVRVAGDGHLWVRSDQHMFEQTASGFADRGGAPIYPTLFDVAANGDVWIASESFTDEVFQIWKLPHGGAGWIKTGSLTQAMLGTAGSSIEGGFSLDAAVGAFAPDGSVHLLSSARCIGTGERNKTQLYIRSRDGVTWDVETVPDIGTFVDGQVTWRDEAVWASDYDNVRFVNESSPPPIQESDGTWDYPDRQLNAIARCLDGQQQAFQRIAKVRLPGWTVRGFAGFSETGQVAFATTLGLTQAYQ